MSDDLDNKLNKFKKFSQEVDTNLHSLRMVKIKKSNFTNSVYYAGNFLNHHLAPVRQDLQRPFKLRKARKPYWRQQSPYGLIKPYDVEELRAFGNTPFVNQCKTIIISETLSAKYEIVPSNDMDFSNETMQKKKIVETWLKAINRNGDNLKDILKPFINDILDLGIGIMIKGFVKDAYFHIQRSNSDTQDPVEQAFPNAFEWTYVPSKIKAGMIRELTTHDAGTFFAQPDEFGQTLGWWQWLQQTTPTFFSRREVVEFNYQPLSYNAYGVSPVDVVKNLVNVLVTSVANMEQYMEDGAIPPAVGILQGVSDVDFNIFADRWDASVAGQQSEIPLMSTGEEGKFDFVQLISKTEEIKQLDTIEAYQKIVMSVFHVTPAELGITDAVNKASAEQQSAVQQRAAIFPLLDGLENLINRYVLREFDPEGKLTFKWIRPKTVQEEKEEWDLIQSQLQSGYYTINDVKKKKGEALKAWGDVPYSEGVWSQLASEFDPELYGFKEQKEDSDTAKIEYAQRQVLTLLEQMQYGLQNDKELTPIALQMLTRLKLLREALHPAGTLSLPPSSVVETENMIDAMLKTDKWETTTEIFDKYKQEELVSLRQIKKSADEEIIDKAIGVKGTFNPFKKKVGFYLAANNILDKLESKKYQRRLDRLHNPIERGLTNSILTIYRSWFGRLKKFLFKFDKEDMVKAFPSTFMSKATEAIDDSIRIDDFREIIKDSFVDAFTIGLRRNNLAKVEASTAKTNVKRFQPRAYNWLEQNALYFADSLAEDQTQDIKGIILRGLAEGKSVPNITKGIKSILAPTDNKDKRSVAIRAKRIARTEVIRASVQGTLAQMETLGATHWQHHTHFDERNINEKEFFDKKRNILIPPCRDQHGKIYKIDDTRLLPVLHPNCRCTILSVFKGRKPTIPEKKSADDCVSKWIRKLKKEPKYQGEDKHKQVIAIAHSKCGIEKKDIETHYNFQWKNVDMVVKEAIQEKEKERPDLKKNLVEIQRMYDETTSPFIKATLAIELLRIMNIWEDEDEEEDFLYKKGIEGLQNIVKKISPQQYPKKLKLSSQQSIKAYITQKKVPQDWENRSAEGQRKYNRLHKTRHPITKKPKKKIIKPKTKKRRVTKILSELVFLRDIEEQALITKEEEAVLKNKKFKRWFGKSKVINDKGLPKKTLEANPKKMPKIVFHGTRKEFDKFDPKKGRMQALGAGFYFTDKIETAREFADFKKGKDPIIIPAFLKIENPVYIDDQFKGKRDTKISEKQISKIHELFLDERFIEEHNLKIPKAQHHKFKTFNTIRKLPSTAIREIYETLGYDGIIKHYDDDETYFVAFEPTQIKSVDAENFDDTDPNIYKTITEADVEVFIPEIISNDAEAMKLHKFEVNYRPSQSAKKCKNCTFFLRGKCKIVAGDIKPEYVCDRWRSVS